jgi:hypothetical protein
VKGLTTTAVLAALLVGLGAYIYFYEWGEQPAAEEKEKAFASVTADDIEELQIKAASGETSHLRRGANGWEIVEPVKATADPSEISSITSNLSSLEVQRVVDENPGDVTQYGLNPPKVDVGFRLKNDKNFRHLLVGEKTATGGDLYARRQDDKKVFLISSFLDNTFNRTTFDLRDKRILDIDREKVDSVEIVNGRDVVQVVKSGDQWKVAKPFEARGDYGAIEGLVTRLSSGQMQRIVDAEAKDLKQYGLDRPATTVTVAAGSARASLLFGATEAQAVYAKDASRPMVFAVEESLVNDVRKPAGDLRRKDVFDFRSFTANRIEVRRGADTLAFEKTKDKEGKDIWRTAGGEAADTTKVEDLLTKLSNLRATSFETTPPAALKSPEMTVNVRFDENKTETVTLAKSGSDAYAARTGEPGAAKLEATPYDDAVKALEGLKP